MSTAKFTSTQYFAIIIFLQPTVFCFSYTSRQSNLRLLVTQVVPGMSSILWCGSQVKSDIDRLSKQALCHTAPSNHAGRKPL